MALMIECGGTNWSLARARALGPEVQVKVTNMDDLINQVKNVSFLKPLTDNVIVKDRVE